MARVQPVVLAGGSGSRLWPVSTAERPKHLLNLVGDESLLAQTIARFGDQALFEPPIIVCAATQEHAISEAAPGCRLIVEPVPRGSAAAIAFAAHAAGQDASLLVVPSDHHIVEPASLFEAVRRALPFAVDGRLVTFGIAPTRPETGYGYITLGSPIGDGVFETEMFVEKPELARAEQLVASKTAYWNSGMFLFSAMTLLEELERHSPAIGEAVRGSMAAADNRSHIRPAAEPLAGCPSTSIDYAVMEHSNRIAVVPIDLDWSDVGSWASVYDLADKDDAGNAVEDGSRALDSRNCLIRSDGPKVVAIGVEDLVVVATADAVLIVPRSEAQRVREAADAFKDGSGA